MTGELDLIADKVAACEPLTQEETEQVIGSDDLIGIGAMADCCRRRKHGNVVTFVRVQTVPLLPFPEPVEVASVAGELRLVGSPESVRDAVAVTERVVATAGGVPVTGFTLSGLAAVCGGECTRLIQLLTDLSVAGLAMVSEVRVDDDRCWEWLKAASAAGLEVAHLTLGFLGSDSDDVGQLRAVAAAGGALEPVRTLAPLASGAGTAPTTGFREVRRVALARLLVDNIDSIQVDWGLNGPKLGQVALAFGADDVDAVSVVDSSEHGWRRSPLEEITRNIRAASLVPSQRDGRFDRLNT